MVLMNPYAYQRGGNAFWGRVAPVIAWIEYHKNARERRDGFRSSYLGGWFS